jgi:hypothetical protein
VSAVAEQKPVEVIDKTVHWQILKEMTRVCEIANVPPQFVRNSMKSYCTDSEIEWVRTFNVTRKDGLGGLCLTGADSITRCMAVTGTLVRHFVDARLMTLNNVVGSPEAAVLPTVLVIPNFYVKSTAGKQLTGWQVQTLFDVMLARFSANKPTVVYVEDKKALALDYGAQMADHIQQFAQA